MIVYDLICDSGHEFEGWFESRKDYNNQKKQGIINCPLCNSSIIDIRLSPVGFVKSGHTDKNIEAPDMALEKIEKIYKQISDFVSDNFEDVGASFADKAIDMHYGLEEQKNIMGTTTKEEDKLLEKEGIKVISIPEILKKMDC